MRSARARIARVLIAEAGGAAHVGAVAGEVIVACARGGGVLARAGRVARVGGAHVVVVAAGGATVAAVDVARVDHRVGHRAGVVTTHAGVDRAAIASADRSA